MSVGIVGAAFLAACSEDAESQYKDAKSTPMTFVVKHPSQTRATETDFEIGDRIGLMWQTQKSRWSWEAILPTTMC